MAFELIDLELEELSLVDRPANAEAKVSLFKRDNPQEENMDELNQQIEALKADLEAKTTEVETLKSDIETVKADRERLTKALLDEGFSIEAEAITKRAPVEEIEVQGVMVNKADLPEVVVKALEAAAIEKADIALAKKASEELPNFDLGVAKAVVKAFGQDEAVMQALKAADRVFKSKMEENGTVPTDADMTDPEVELAKMVAEHNKANPNKTHSQSYAAVVATPEGKTLLNKSYNKD